MNRVVFDLKKANVRTLLPVSSFGLACMWSALLGVIFLESTALPTPDLPNLLKLAFFVGAFVAMLVVYLKRSVVVDDEGNILSWVGAALFSLAGITGLLLHAGIAVPDVILVVAWALAGCGYALLYLNWPRAFMVSWQQDVSVFLALGASLGAVFFLFARNLIFPYGDIALLSLPLVSVVVLKYVDSHIVKGVPVEEGKEELTRLNPIIGLSVVLFGVIFGTALFQVASHQASANLDIVSLFLLLGAIAFLAVVLSARQYIPFGRMEKIAMIACLLCGLVLAFGGHSASALCYLCILSFWVFLDFANYSALIGFSSSHRNPYWQIARGEMVLFGGIGIAWAFCAVSQQCAPHLLGYSNYICLATAVLLTLIATISPFPDNMYSDKNAYGSLSGDDALALRCEFVSKKYKLSSRESEIIPYLARGRNAQYVSEQLTISVYTARTHIYHIYQKVGVSTQQELITVVESEDIEVL